MKRLFLILLIATCANASAQLKKNGIEKVTFGIVFAGTGTTPIFDGPTTTKSGYAVCGNVFFSTRKTYTNLMAGVNKSDVLFLKMINGYKPIPMFGVYNALSKNLNSQTMYVGFGAEKFIKADGTMFFIFCEVGRNFYPVSNVVVAGFHVNLQANIWKRKN